MKKIYGIGTGPGHKEHLTLKAVNAIKESEVIFAPNNRGKNMALDTVKDFIEDKKIVLLDFPMGKVEEKHYDEAVEIIKKEILEGKSGAFLTIGDPLIYSTFIYLMERLVEKNVQVEIVPGIPSFLASAALIKRPLTVKGDRFLLCDGELTEEMLKNCDSIAILKTNNNKKETLDLLENNGFSWSYVKRTTLDGEKVLSSGEDVIKDKDYISLIIGRREEND